MTVKIQEKEYELWYSMRIYLMWESAKGKSISNEDLTSFSTLVDLFYYAVLNTWKHNNDKLDISYDEFLDWVDENGDVTLVNLFGFWFANQIKNSAEIVNMLSSQKQEDTGEENEQEGKKKQY